MRYPIPRNVEQWPDKKKSKFLAEFREQVELNAQILADQFPECVEAADVIKSLIEARMWSGNLFGYIKTPHKKQFKALQDAEKTQIDGEQND